MEGKELVTRAMANMLAKEDLQTYIDVGYDAEFPETFAFILSSTLLAAAHHDNQELMQILLDSGVNLDMQNQYGDSALHKASYNGNVKAVEMLLVAGADITLRNHDLETPLGVARMQDHQEVARLLSSRPAMKSPRKPAFHSNNQQHISGANLSGAEFVARVYNETLTLEMLQVFIETGNNVNYQDDLGNSALLYAGWRGQARILDALLANGATARLRNKYEDTVLHKAALGNNPLCVKVILKAILAGTIHRNILIAKNRNKKTALDIAVDLDHIAVVKLLCVPLEDIDLQAPVHGSVFLDLVREDKLSVASLLDHIASGIAVNVKDDEGMTALMYASWNGNQLLTQHLLAAKSDPSELGPNNRTALHEAVINNQLQVLNILLEAKGNVNAKDVNDKTALNYAIETDNLDMIDVLTQYTTLVPRRPLSSSMMSPAAQPGQATDSIGEGLEVDGDEEESRYDGNVTIEEVQEADSLFYKTLAGQQYLFQFETALKAKYGNTCMVTGTTSMVVARPLLPYAMSSMEERYDPCNGLVLIQPLQTELLAKRATLVETREQHQVVILSGMGVIESNEVKAADDNVVADEGRPYWTLSLNNEMQLDPLLGVFHGSMIGANLEKARDIFQASIPFVDKARTMGLLN